MRKCIFCERTEAEFINGNHWTEEHIIPESVGNETLKIYDVCKECNSGLGTYVDNYFVNHKLIEIIRQHLGLKGQSGKIPNPFKEGKDKNNHLIRVNEKFEPYTVPYVEQTDEKIRIVASTTDEAMKMARKKLERMNFTNDQIEQLLEGAKHKSEEEKPEVRYDATIEFNRFFMEALKIAYEYAVDKLGEEYLGDITAKKIRKYLYKAIKGEMKTECLECPNVCWAPHLIDEVAKQTENTHFHMLALHKDAGNKLVVDIILFNEGAFSFSVCISENANQYATIKEIPPKIIEINGEKTNC